MRFLAGAVLLSAALTAFAQITPEIQRSLIQRDQQSAEFAARLRDPGGATALEGLHARQLLDVVTHTLSPDPQVARQLQPYQRQQMTNERALVLPPPVVLRATPAPEALPLPGGPRHAVDPIPVQSVPY